MFLKNPNFAAKKTDFYRQNEAKNDHQMAWRTLWEFPYSEVFPVRGLQDVLNVSSVLLQREKENEQSAYS